MRSRQRPKRVSVEGYVTGLNVNMWTGNIKFILKSKYHRKATDALSVYVKGLLPLNTFNQYLISSGDKIRIHNASIIKYNKVQNPTRLQVLLGDTEDVFFLICDHKTNYIVLKRKNSNHVNRKIIRADEMTVEEIIKFCE